MPTPLSWPLTGGAGSAGVTSLPSQYTTSTTAINYGTDISTYPDLDDTWALITGYTAVAQAIARSLEDRRQGIDIKDWLNEGMTNSDIYALQQTVRTQALSDERVSDVSVSVSLTSSRSLYISIEFTLSDDPSTFRLVLEVTQLSVEVLTLEQA